MNHVISIELDRKNAEHIHHCIKKEIPVDEDAVAELDRAITDALILDDAEEKNNEG